MTELIGAIAMHACVVEGAGVLVTQPVQSGQVGGMILAEMVKHRGPVNLFAALAS